MTNAPLQWTPIEGPVEERPLYEIGDIATDALNGKMYLSQPELHHWDSFCVYVQTAEGRWFVAEAQNG